MSDEMIEIWQALKAADQQERWDSQKTNRVILEQSGLLEKGKLVQEHTLVLRESGKTRVDFYLTRNKWWDLDKKRCRYGDAVDFLQWYLTSQYDVFRFEIGITNEDGETNPNGCKRAYPTLKEAINDLPEFIEYYKDNDDIVEVFIDAWYRDEEGIPYPLNHDVITHRYEEAGDATT